MDKTERQAWHGVGATLEFEPSDFEILDMVLGQIPELRICATALKRARAAGLEYPIGSPKALRVLFGGQVFEGGGHRFGPDEIARFMPAEFFPIHTEAEFVGRVYIALVRCKHEEALAMQHSTQVLHAQQALRGTS
jgi:hypothetical protein